MKRAFTLAEVLITLGIIGIVAAMTLPTVLHNYKKQEVETKIKKFYTTMAQAVKLSEADNGPAYYWTKEARKVNEDGSVTNISGTMAFYNNYLAKYLKRLPQMDKDSVVVILADGSYFYMNIGYCLDIKYDYNGKKPPNSYGIDLFDFLLCTEEAYNTNNYVRNKANAFDAYWPGECLKNNCSRAKLLNYCKNTPHTCSALLMYDGWKFMDDYPYKLR